MKARITGGFVPPWIAALSVAALVFITCIYAQAQTPDDMDRVRYVKPTAEVSVRRGKGTEYKIIALVEDGTAVEVLEEDEAYALVRLDDGKQGWVLKRFLSPDPPLTDVVADLRRENEQGRQRARELAEELRDMTDALSRTEEKLAAAAAAREQTEAAYEQLRQESSQLLEMKNSLIADKNKYQALARNFEQAQKENERLRQERIINWFLAGAGVLLVGMILGRISFSSRKRKSSLLS